MSVAQYLIYSLTDHLKRIEVIENQMVIVFSIIAVLELVRIWISYKAYRRNSKESIYA